MYSNSYGYGVYKKNQVNVGNPYQIKSTAYEKVVLEELAQTGESEDAHKKAQRLIAQAKEEAQLIKREAEFEAERLLSEAKNKAASHIEEIEQSAKEAGYRHGESTAQQHYNDLLLEAEDFKNRSKTEYEETIEDLEQDIIQLALTIAQKVVGAELDLSQDIILKIARDTINACINRDQIILKVSGEDYDFVVLNEDRIRSAVKDLGQLDIRKDQTLSKGSCQIDTGFGMVDGSMDVKMDLIQQAFLEVLGER